MAVIPGTCGEKFVKGMDTLAEMAARNYARGCRFAKWRAAITIGECLPTARGIRAVAEGLARYASICQANGLVPIVEPEILVDGKHSLARCVEVSQRVFAEVFKCLHDENIIFEGMLLKPNMCLRGSESDDKVSHRDVAEATINTLRRTVVAAVPGVFVP